MTVDHTKFETAAREKDLFRFSIGSADFYNHDFYALEEHEDCVQVRMWDLASSYPEQVWEQEGHASVYQIFSPEKWNRIQYGYGLDRPWSAFIPPKTRIAGVLISDEQAQKLFDDWPITELPDYSRRGM